MGTTNIEWTDQTWNPTVGCNRVSPGCKNCYAFALHDMRHEAFKAGKDLPQQYAKPFTELQMMEDRLTDPLHWRKPRRVFVNSVSDLFHKDVPDAFIDRVFGVMASTPQHTYQILTKRADRMAQYMTDSLREGGRWDHMLYDGAFPLPDHQAADAGYERLSNECELKNVWLGVSVEDQKRADERIPLLLQTPAAVRFLSCEPLLGPVDLKPYMYTIAHMGFVSDEYSKASGIKSGDNVRFSNSGPKVDWVIVGGESGPGSRPCNPCSIRAIVKQCRAASAPCFVKQMGSNIVTRNDMVEDAFNGESGWPEPDVEHNIHGFREEYQGADCRIRLRDRKGGDPTEWPADLRVREFPSVGEPASA